VKRRKRRGNQENQGVCFSGFNRLIRNPQGRTPKEFEIRDHTVPFLLRNSPSVNLENS